MLVAITINVVVNIRQSLNFLFHCYHCYIILVYDILYVQVVHLYKRKWVEETTYPHFTMIFFMGICIAIEFVVLLKSLFPSEVRLFLGD